ncbi:hypothetical protein J2Z60_000674 [Lactobacillus colini]|uniref:Alpha/beta hydrolase fold-5 domain-containing protein n=1 Tax=Lactobacillus colini TaxID=1819254 RepID=A0ABS4MCU5_9LACO|nr:alpha/beta hydrolase [Lactobacillus colini]MBP2057503.1 hypothetical protein [Lactobacillus colini]
MKLIKKTIAWLVSIIIIVLLTGSIYLHLSAYQPSHNAQRAAQTATITNKATTFKAKHNRMTVIFYPGALVTPNSYSIWAKKVAASGYTVKIVHFPLNMALLNINAAGSLVAKSEKYVIGGHSLGGAMAARYAHNHNQQLKGIFFLASYPDQKGRLDTTKLAALSITGSRDGVLNWQKYNTNKRYLPKNTQYVTIAGANHGNFGSYGQQKGDKKATISNAQQQNEIAKQLVKWLENINY